MPKGKKKHSLKRQIILRTILRYDTDIEIISKECKIIMINMLRVLRKKQTTCKDRWVMQAEG